MARLGASVSPWYLFSMFRVFRDFLISVFFVFFVGLRGFVVPFDTIHD
jgi:hypothetical protein